MAGGDRTPTSEFDLSTLLWGDLPSPPDTSPISLALPTPLEASIAIDHDSTGVADVTDAEGVAFDEAPAIAGSRLDDEDAMTPDLFVELPDLELLAEFDIDAAEEESATEGEAITAAMADEPELSVAALTERLHRDVLPRLRRNAEQLGYLTLGHLGAAVATLHSSEIHLAEVRRFVARSQVPLLPSRAHHNIRGIPLAAYEQASRLFGDLVRGEPDDALIIGRLGYAGLDLGEGTRQFLRQAWTNHCLSRAEELAFAETIEKEIVRVGTDFRQWSHQAQEAREALVLDNLWLVARTARKYIGQGLEIDDLLQFGTLGLFRAIEKFEPARGYRFVTYASHHVFANIVRAIGEQSSSIRLPLYLEGKRKSVEATAAGIYSATGCDPAPEDVANGCEDVSSADARAILITSRPVSLDDPENRSQIDYQRVLVADEPFELIARYDLERNIALTLESIAPRDALVLRRRFGLEDGQQETLEQIARDLGLTRERIRQIEERALKRLRSPKRRRQLMDYSNLGSMPLPVVSKAALIAVLPHFKRHDQKLLAAHFENSSDAMTETTRLSASHRAAGWYVRSLLRQATLMAADLERRRPPSNNFSAPDRASRLDLRSDNNARTSTHRKLVRIEKSVEHQTEFLPRSLQEALPDSSMYDAPLRSHLEAIERRPLQDSSADRPGSSSIRTSVLPSPVPPLQTVMPRMENLLSAVTRHLFPAVNPAFLEQLIRPHIWRDSRYVGVNDQEKVSVWRGRSINLNALSPRLSCLYADLVTNDLPIEAREFLFGPWFAAAIRGLPFFVVILLGKAQHRTSDDVLAAGFTPRTTPRGCHACSIEPVEPFMSLPLDDLVQRTCHLVQFWSDAGEEEATMAVRVSGI